MEVDEEDDDDEDEEEEDDDDFDDIENEDENDPEDMYEPMNVSRNWIYAKYKFTCLPTKFPDNCRHFCLFHMYVVTPPLCACMCMCILYECVHVKCGF